MTISAINARFAYNNYLESTALQTTASQAGYPFSNAISPIRSKLWKPQNLFKIYEKNCKVYIDGSTYTVASGTYTKDGLITAFNAAVAPISGTLTYNSFYNHFELNFLTLKTVNFSNQTNSIWKLLGFLRETDVSTTYSFADEKRYNSGIEIQVDLGLPQLVDFAALLAPAGEVFSLNTAEIKLQGNNVNQWESMPVNLDFEVSGEGAFFSGTPNQPCRFWRILINDFKNNAASIAVAFMGSAVICSNTNIATGFTRSREDTSIKLVSENGTFYIDRRPKVLSLSSLSVQLLKDEELMEMEQLFYDLGVEKPFFIAIDPKKQVSTNLSQMTHYVAATSPLQLQHILRGYYNLSIDLREVV